MMLRPFSPGFLWRYVFAGSALGAAAPLANLYLLATAGDPLSGLHRFASDPLLLATAALPFAGGYLGHRIGRRTLKLRERIRELEHRRRELQDVASRDPLTGIGNRLAMEQGCKPGFPRPMASAPPFSPSISTGSNSSTTRWDMTRAIRC